MIVRTVRMTLAPERVDDFLKMFDKVSSMIRSFEGCHFLELHQNVNFPNVITTFSHWESSEHLNAYRGSELFQGTWSETKTMFANKPVAQSWIVIREVAS